ncbi:MAG TPA: hypothetical protein VKV17_15820 [Bryobacteraceae bacterium]|nr:hypothetical protein [Bryobacteraceae bacterium]
MKKAPGPTLQNSRSAWNRYRGGARRRVADFLPRARQTAEESALALASARLASAFEILRAARIAAKPPLTAL